MPKKYEYPKDLGFRFRLQPPAGRHKGFRIVKLFDDGHTETVRPPELEGINKLPLERARKECELLVERLYREAGVKKFKSVSNSDNVKVLEEFWADVYGSRRLVDRESAYAKYRRAVDAVGEWSLRSASARELQQAVDSNLKGNRQREAVGRLTFILKWLGRADVRLVLELEEESIVCYLTHAELIHVLTFIEDENFKLACRVARATGARMGELLAMKPGQLASGAKTVFIRHQLRRDGTHALAKSKKADSPGRTAFVLPEGRLDLKKWADGGKTKFTPEMRLNAANILRAACEQAFPNDSDKHLKFHDLRHSYAIELAQAGVSLLQISQQLGNSERICQKHYTGYMATDESIDLIERKLKKA